jgi:hypothetical protein
VAAVGADRRALRAATHADLEPVVFAHGGPPGPAAALAEQIVAARPPDADLTDDVGVRHRLWRVADPAELATVRADLARRHAVIADGHHRWAAASPPAATAAHAASVGAATGDGSSGGSAATTPAAAPTRAASVGGATGDGGSGGSTATTPTRAASSGGATAGGEAGGASADGAAAGRVLALVVPAGEHGPQVRAIHRVLPGTTLDRLDVRRFRSADVGPLTAAGAEELLAAAAAPLVLATDGERWWRLTEPDTATVTPAAWRELPVGLVDVLLVGERAVVLRHSVAAAVDEARRSGGVALLVPATPTATVLDLAARGVLMPRKSTFFVPKPRTGLVLRCFADQP